MVCLSPPALHSHTPALDMAEQVKENEYSRTGCTDMGFKHKKMDGKNAPTNECH